MAIYRFSLTKNLDISEIQDGGVTEKAPANIRPFAGADTSYKIISGGVIFCTFPVYPD